MGRNVKLEFRQVLMELCPECDGKSRKDTLMEGRELGTKAVTFEQGLEG